MKVLTLLALLFTSSAFALNQNLDGQNEPLMMLKTFVHELRFTPVQGAGINFSACYKHQEMFIHLYLSNFDQGPFQSKRMFFEMSTSGNQWDHQAETLNPIRGDVVEEVLDEDGRPLTFETEDGEHAVLSKSPWRVYVVETERSYNNRLSSNRKDCLGQSIRSRFIGVVNFDLTSFSFFSYEYNDSTNTLIPSGTFQASGGWSWERRLR